MNNATPVVLALLLVLSLPAMTVMAASPYERNDDFELALQQESSPRTTPTVISGAPNRLQLTGDIRGEQTAYSSGLGFALASADDELRIDHMQYTIVDDDFSSATAQERATMIQTAYERLMDRADELEQRERDAVRAHAVGDRSTAAVLQTLLRNYNEAEALSESLAELEERSVETAGYSLPSTRADVKMFNAHRTPVRELVAQQATANGIDQHDVSISTSLSGYSLSVMDDNRYIVETTRFDNRNETAANQFENREAFDHTLQLYPWADEHGKPYFQDNSPNHYWTEIVHDHGRLEVYLDSGTGNVYREVQELAAPSLPVTNSRTRTNGNLEITVNETPANGPVQVTVTEIDSDGPTASTIMLNGHEVGDTAADGTLWVVPPSNEYRLTAKTASGNVSVTFTGN